MPLIIIPPDIRRRLATLSPTQIEELRARSSTSPVRESQLDSSQTTGPAAPVASGPRPTTKRRRHVDRTDQWPDVGTVLEGQFRGEVFRAQVIAAPKLKSKKALKLLTAPVKGTVATSFSRAQDVITLAYRQKLGLRGKTGLPPAWGWWKPVNPQT